jgi:hypothetical protein
VASGTGSELIASRTGIFGTAVDPARGEHAAGSRRGPGRSVNVSTASRRCGCAHPRARKDPVISEVIGGATRTRAGGGPVATTDE